MVLHASEQEEIYIITALRHQLAHREAIGLTDHQYAEITELLDRIEVMNMMLSLPRIEDQSKYEQPRYY